MRNDSGFTLVELMIAAGVAGILALGISDMMVNMNKSQSNAAADVQVMNGAMVAGLALNDSTTCGDNIPSNFSGAATFNQSLPPAQLQAQTVGLKQIATSSGSIVLKPGTTLGTVTVNNIYLTKFQVISPTQAVAQVEVQGQKLAHTYLGSPIAIGYSGEEISLNTKVLTPTQTQIIGCGTGGGASSSDEFFSFTITTNTHDQSDFSGSFNLPTPYPDMNYYLICSQGNAFRHRKNYGVLYTWVSWPGGIGYDYYQERGDYQAPLITVNCMTHHP